MLEKKMKTKVFCKNLISMFIQSLKIEDITEMFAFCEQPLYARVVNFEEISWTDGRSIERGAMATMSVPN